MRCLTFLLFIFLISIECQAVSIPIYFTDFKVPARWQDNYYAGFSPATLAADLSNLLATATKDSYSPIPYQGQRTTGIYLILDSSLPASATETGYLEYQPNKIIFKARYVTGLSYALYSWLDEKGFRF
ncbi:MAG TPA: hypothetical protein PKK69_09795, partial [Ferruginibacter sp.]|nr:hypothetical protein [Ferruginibacter sp.]